MASFPSLPIHSPSSFQMFSTIEEKERNLLSEPSTFFKEKPKRKEIYQMIEAVICKIETSKGAATGFILEKNVIAVPFHALDFKLIEQISESEAKVSVEPARIHYQGITYPGTWYLSELKTSQQTDIALFFIEDKDFNFMPGVEFFNGKIELGDKVYYGGFPLTQEDPTIHSGLISSISEKNGMRTFTIDGTVVPGNSGGPVFILQDNRLQLVGVVTYQVADFIPEDKKTINIMKELKKQSELNPITNSGGVNLDWRGTSVELTIPIGNGRFEKKWISTLDTIVLALDLIQRNLSTGIGRAIHATHLVDVIEGRTIDGRPGFDNILPVMRHERLPGMLSKDPTYKEWYHRHVKGKQLCIDIIGRQIPADGHIESHEEKLVWKYYCDNPLYNGFVGLTATQSFDKLLEKVFCARPKILKQRGEAWKNEIEEIKLKLSEEEFTKERQKHYQNAWKVLT